jgi:hypothetical protein
MLPGAEAGLVPGCTAGGVLVPGMPSGGVCCARREKLVRASRVAANIGTVFMGKILR